MTQQPQSIALRPMEIKSLYDFAIRLYRSNFAPMFLAMAIVQLPYALLVMPVTLKLVELSNEFSTLQVSGQLPDQAWALDKLDEGLLVILIMIVAFFYQVLVTPLGNLACARIGRESLFGNTCSFGEAFAFARTRYWPTQVAIALFVLPLLVVSILVLLPVLAFQSAGNETGIIASSLFGLTIIWLGATITPLFFPRFFPAINGIMQSEEAPGGEGMFAQGLWYLKRSYGLTQGYYFRLVGLLVLMSFAVNMIIRGISESMNMLVAFIQAAVSGGEIGTEIMNALQTQDLFGVGLVLTVSTVFTIVIVPVWQTLKVLLYFDLRCRKEAYDLKLLLEQK